MKLQGLDHLYAGHVAFDPPVRDKFSKFFISLDEYKYNMFPPFINAGAYVMSNQAVRKFYLASYFVKRFRFDDVYLGIIAKKCYTKPYHSKYFVRFRDDSTIGRLNFTIASHEFGDTSELKVVWDKQKQFGNA